MLRMSMLLLICVGTGCAARRAQTDAAGTAPCREDVSLSESLWFDKPGGLAYNLFGYDAVRFGPVGRRILSERRPQDMALLKAALENTDGPRTIVVDGHLPLRQCDYALLIAEELLDHDVSPSGHSFGPPTAYEYRDDARRNVVRELFGSDALPERGEYVYLNLTGKDISKERCLVRFGP